jgi:hypothetical protein
MKEKLVLVLVVFSLPGYDQDKVKLKKLLRDSVDYKLDGSDFLIHSDGFIPVPQLITEPALGHIALKFYSNRIDLQY